MKFSGSKFFCSVVAAAAALTFCGVAAAQGGMQSKVYSGLSGLPNRIVGSANLESSISLIESELRAAGIETHRETFPSLVQRTDKCELTIGGARVAGAMMPDLGIASWVLDVPVTGHLVYAGSGDYDELDGLDLNGAIAVLDLRRGRVDIRPAFTLGAKGVIFVGDKDVSQWDAASVLVGQTATLIPSMYLDAADAARAGIVPAEGDDSGNVAAFGKAVSMDAHVTLSDVVGQNLWAVIPGKDGWKGTSDSAEVVILSTTLDSYGFIPERSPDLRRLANAALLTEVAKDLAKQQNNRTVIIVFFGSNYAGVEGARYFYYALDLVSNSTAKKDLMQERAERYAFEYNDVTNMLASIGNDDVLSNSDPFSRAVSTRCKKVLLKFVNQQRVPMSALNRRVSILNSELVNTVNPCTPERAEEIKRELAELKAELAEEQERKERWGALQGQISSRKLDTSNEENLKAFNEVRDEVRGDLQLREKELSAIMRHHETVTELGAQFRDKLIVAHFDFDFASDKAPWMLSMINSTGLFRHEPANTGDYSGHFAAIGRLYESAVVSNRLEGDAPIFREALAPLYKPFSLSLPRQRVVPTSCSLCLGFAGFQMMTVGDQLAGDSMPYASDCDLTGLIPQMSALCKSFANDPALAVGSVKQSDATDPRFTYTRSKSSDTRDFVGMYFQTLSPGSSEAEGYAKNAIAVATGCAQYTPMVGQSFNPRARVEANGYIFFPYLSRNAFRSYGSSIVAFGYDENGMLNRAMVDSETSASNFSLFYSFGGLAFNFGYAPDPVGSQLYQPKTLRATKDDSYKNIANVRIQNSGGATEMYVDKPDKIKRIGANGQLILGSSPDNSTGSGIEIVKGALLNLDGVWQGANDYYYLNNKRLQDLRARNIVSGDLEGLHADAKDHLDAANESKEDRKWGVARAHEIFSTNISNRVYGPLRGVTDDLVHAVIVLLLLNIPFAFAMERLIFGFTSIYKQVMGFVGFFLATFAILFVTHPAFSLAKSPIIIFLAFVIILLAVMAISIVMGKIKHEIRAMQGLASTVHGIDSDSSTSAAAVLIGISGMRNRPLKTFLTAITVVLLTFTILVFASFTSRQGVVDTYLGKGSDADRIELHRYSFLDIDQECIRGIRSMYGDSFDVCRRGGVFYNPAQPLDSDSVAPDRVIYNPRTQKTAPVSAIMGLDVKDAESSAMLGEVVKGFGKEDSENAPIYISEVIRESMDAQIGDELMINGFKFTLAGITDTQKLQNMSTIDDLKITPPDFQTTSKNGGASSLTTSALEEIDPGSFEWFSPGNIAIARMGDLRRFFGDSAYVNMIVMYPKTKDIDIDAVGKRIAPVFHGTVHTKNSAGAHKLFFTKLVEGSGFGDVVVPLLIGGLIIFSSLMGSIVDREKEIFTYSALGLAPPDVGALFFAESAVYSVIGGMGGYLLSQVVAKVLSTLGRMGILTPPEMNFSSLTSVMTILIVMAVVMLSTIYPAIKAGKSANPGVARKWKMPAPEGDNLRFVFPFTVSENDFAGILSFISEHFANHADATLGSFAANNVKLFKLPGAKGGEDAIGIEANVSLAPFDLGIFQKFRMYSSEFEIEGIDEVVVELKRLGGTPSSWIRSNRVFAAELRQQFLLWRSLPIETIEFYRAQTAKTLGEVGNNDLEG